METPFQHVTVCVSRSPHAFEDVTVDGHQILLNRIKTKRLTLVNEFKDFWLSLSCLSVLCGIKKVCYYDLLLPCQK